MSSDYSEIERRVTTLEEDMKELKDGFIGTMREAGLKQTIHDTRDTVLQIKEEFASLKENQQSLLNERIRIKGMVAGILIFGGAVQWVVTQFIFKK